MDDIDEEEERCIDGGVEEGVWIVEGGVWIGRGVENEVLINGCTESENTDTPFPPSSLVGKEGGGEVT